MTKKYTYCPLQNISNLGYLGTKAEQRARVDRPQTCLSLPVILLLAVSRRLLCFGSFGDFRCGVLIFTVILVIYKYKNR